MRRRLAGCVLFLALAACGGPTMPSAPTLTGVWEGAIVSPSDAGGPITLQLTQIGPQVAGTVDLFQNGEHTPGILAGMADGAATSLQYTIIYTYRDGCAGSFGGVLTVTNGTMAGQYSGHNCARDFVGTLQATKK